MVLLGMLVWREGGGRAVFPICWSALRELEQPEGWGGWGRHTTFKSWKGEYPGEKKK